MADFTIDASEFQRFAATMAGAPAIVKREQLMAMQRSVLEVQGEAQRVTPVVTGTLRRSITTTATPLEGTVGTNVPYARAVHDGRREVRPVNARVLHWVAPGGQSVFAMRSRATSGNPFLLAPFNRLRPAIRAEFLAALKRIAAQLAQG